MNTDCAVIWSLSYADINMYVLQVGKLPPCIAALLKRLSKQHKSNDEARMKDEKKKSCFISVSLIVVNTKSINLNLAQSTSFS